MLLSLGENTDNDAVRKIVESFQKDDDVFSNDFLTDTVMIQRTVGKPSTSKLSHVLWDTLNLNTSDGPWKPARVITVDAKHELPPGPYFLASGNTLAQAWRLFPDTQDAFTTTFVPASNNSLKFDAVNVMTNDGLSRQVAVPSRLYTTPTAVKPLAGKRISVKDIFKVTGIKTTQNNRAWVDLYGPDDETALFVQRLIELGAVIVGKTKMHAFASAEEPTDQWIDFHAPFNPRGDEYQTPSGSTGGGAAALASYEWLDYSIGTDTTGSIRWPAAYNGLYGLRTSWNSTSLEGIYPSCRSMDTIGLLARDIDGLRSLTTHSMAFSPDLPDRLPKQILYCTDFLPHENSAQNSLVDEFVSGLETHLGIERTNISILERWLQCPPPEAEGKDLKTYTNKTSYNLFYYDGYNEYADFREEYEKKTGKPVFLGPYMRWKWDRGAEVTLEDKKQAEKELAVYQRWFQENVMNAEDGGGSNAVLILPCGSSDPKYRDLPNPSPNASPAYNMNYISSMQGLPQIVVPVGQIPFESRISKRTEYLPITASMATASGSDLLLISLAKAALESAQKPSQVLTGRFAFKI
ncbi:putative amidase [Hypoxylon rubiginosum]|uniref:Amidase n=1 Tax=Hypoxylon rubiginosum TaxID=110542 RepID=A0ACC0D1D1_9PEZI|nr:putative amidase [Hypoxylon rubiginosum]